ncbi:hypothetical protein FAF44_09915 [Nonomuraea sp. MG754425]|uniref:hypothetical protein n=1 Tax=Nonomuraea sp. MG754425 TaxID=2570319 RepID=UPI001F372135|nr:hypothetical protein [Nonomuraea sp. MG754425]MCF6468701.1 hypothetical protein [Nonomuraea sp. MG754425]
MPTTPQPSDDRPADGADAEPARQPAQEPTSEPARDDGDAASDSPENPKGSDGSEKWHGYEPL